MSDPTSRLLRLISLLQTHRRWSGTQLADRLDVTTRTIRRDVDRLRDLGYPVSAEVGPDGGYRLEAGSEVPPLLLDDEEAVAIAVGLRTAAQGAVAGIEEISVRALAKLEQVLPTRLRRRVNALAHYALPLPASPGPTVDVETLAVLTLACRDHERVRFRYTARDDAVSRREVEPHRLVSSGRRWYLLAWDAGRQDWRTFRVDRLDSVQPTALRFTEREVPGGDAAAFVQQALREGFPRHVVVVRLHAPVEALQGQLPGWAGELTADGPAACVLRSETESLEWTAMYLGHLGVDFEVLEPDDFAACVRTIAERLAQAVG